MNNEKKKGNWYTVNFCVFHKRLPHPVFTVFEWSGFHFHFWWFIKSFSVHFVLELHHSFMDKTIHDLHSTASYCYGIEDIKLCSASDATLIGSFRKGLGKLGMSCWRHFSIFCFFKEWNFSLKMYGTHMMTNYPSGI